MPAYNYKALNSNGREEKGSVEADTLRQAKTRIKEKGLFLVDIKESSGRQGVMDANLFAFLKPQKRLKLGDLAIITRQLGTLLVAGIPLLESLESLALQMDKLTIKEFLLAVRSDVQNGMSLHKALKSSSWTCPNLLLSMVEAGEASGSLDRVMIEMADYLEGQMALRRKVIGAMVYPATVMFFSVIVVLFLFAKVVPSVTELFVKQGRALPAPTIITMFISRMVLDYWFILAIGVAAVVVAFSRYQQTAEGKKQLHLLYLRLPIFGNGVRKVQAAKVASSLSTLMSSGVGLLEALEITKNIINNVHVKKALENAKDGVKEGKSLSKELGKFPYFPLLMIQMVGVGERTGSLENMLNRASTHMEREVASTLEGLTAALQPLMIIGLGGSVMFIIVSIMLPMANMLDMIK